MYLGVSRSLLSLSVSLIPTPRSDEQEKAKVRDCAKKAEKWLFQKLDQQANLPPSKDPVRVRVRVLSEIDLCRPLDWTFLFFLLLFI